MSKLPHISPKHLVSGAPHTSWDGWFAIAIPPPSSEIRWLKAHCFKRTCLSHRHPLASLEGMDQTDEMLLAYSTADKLTCLRYKGNVGELHCEQEPLQVEIRDRFKLSGDCPNYEETFQIQQEKARVEFKITSGWPIWWSRMYPFLKYLGVHSQLSVKLSHGTLSKELDCFGVFEHVCGISTPLDVVKWLPFHWHWDVLRFDTDDIFASAAGLSLGRYGRTWVPLHAAAKFPHKQDEVMRGLYVRYLESETLEDAQGRKFFSPVKWEGEFCTWSKRFHYQATAITKPAMIVPSGGMLAFSFQGELTSDGKSTVLKGTGFTEYGDPVGHLV